MPDETQQRERHRTIIDDARREGIGEAEEGTAPVVPSYADAEPNEVTDLGVDEPVVPEDLQGEPPHRHDPDDDR